MAAVSEEAFGNFSGAGGGVLLVYAAVVVGMGMHHGTLLEYGRDPDRIDGIGIDGMDDGIGGIKEL